MRRYDGLRRIAFAALSAGPDGLTERLVRASECVHRVGPRPRPARPLYRSPRRSYAPASGRPARHFPKSACELRDAPARSRGVFAW